MEKTSQRVSDLIQEAATAHTVKGSVAQKVGDYYASFVNQNAIEAKGLTPLADEMATISAITSKASLSAYLGATLNTEVDGLTANADHVFGVWVNQSFTDSDHYVSHLLQGGLGMPDLGDYLDPSPKMAELRVHYQAHIAAVLKLAGTAEAETKAARILTLETRIAQAHAPDSDAADVFKQNNPWKRADFAVKAPGMDWDAYFKAAGIARQAEFIVWQPSAVTGTSALVGSEGIEVWKDYLRFHLIEHYASVLPRRWPPKISLSMARFCPARKQTPEPPERPPSPLQTPPWARRSANFIRNVISRPKPRRRRKPWLPTLITAYRARIANLSMDVSADQRKGVGQAGRAQDRRWLSRHLDRLFDARYRARRRSWQYATRGSFQSFVQPRQAETSGRSGRVENRSANRRCRHYVHTQYRNVFGRPAAATVFRLARATRRRTTAPPALASPTKSATASTN